MMTPQPYTPALEIERMRAEGWELVAVLAGKNVWDYTLFFKRRKD